MPLLSPAAVGFAPKTFLDLAGGVATTNTDGRLRFALFRHIQQAGTSSQRQLLARLEKALPAPEVVWLE